MEFSSLVLMEKNMDTNEFVREIASYQVTAGAEYITKMYYDGKQVNIFFSTLEDVEDWKYYAIYDLFNSGVFEDEGYSIEEVEDEYNPTWHMKTDLIDDVQNMQNKVKEICSMIKNEMERVFDELQENQDTLKEEYTEIDN